MSESLTTTKEKLRKFSNSYTFAKVMGDNPDLCKRVIERILRIKIQDLIMISSEETIALIEERGVRCDVLAYDSTTYFELEMQACSEPDLDKRMQYLESAITMRSAKKGIPYAKIPPRAIIAICTYDPYEANRTLYSFHTRCDDDYEIVQNRGTTNLVINTSTIEPNLSEDLANFCQYVQNGVVADTDDLTADLSSAVDEAILDEQWVSLVNRYDFDMVNAEYRGEQRGEQRGREEGRIEEINNLVTDGVLTPKQAAERIERILGNKPTKLGESCE